MRSPDYFIRRVPMTSADELFIGIYNECYNAPEGVYMPKQIIPVCNSREALVYFEQAPNYSVVNFMYGGEYLVINDEFEEISTTMTAEEIAQINEDGKISINGTVYGIADGYYMLDSENISKTYTFYLEEE